MLEIEHAENVAVLKMNHGKVNAMDLEFCRALTAQLAELADSESSAVVLTSATGVFSAGIDLRRWVAEQPDYVDVFLDAFEVCTKALLSFPKPLVAAVNGHAVAGGCVLAAACDHRVLDSRAKIGVPELRIGVPFPPIALEIIRMVASPQAFQTMINAGQTYRHESAIEVGLADSVAAPDEVVSSAIGVAKQWAEMPLPVFQITKQQARMPVLQNVQQAEQELGSKIRTMWNSPENRKLIEEYVEQRL